MHWRLKVNEAAVPPMRREILSHRLPQMRFHRGRQVIVIKAKKESRVENCVRRHGWRHGTELRSPAPSGLRGSFRLSSYSSASEVISSSSPPIQRPPISPSFTPLKSSAWKSPRQPSASARDQCRRQPLRRREVDVSSPPAILAPWSASISDLRTAARRRAARDRNPAARVQ